MENKDTSNIKSVVVYFGRQNKAYTSYDELIVNGDGVLLKYSKEVHKKTSLNNDISFPASEIDKMVVIGDSLKVWVNAWKPDYLNRGSKDEQSKS